LLDASLVEMVLNVPILSVSREWRERRSAGCGAGYACQGSEGRRRAGLYVRHRRLMVSVKGTIFSFQNRGTKRLASVGDRRRCSVALRADRTVELTAGERRHRAPALAKVPIQNEVGVGAANSGKYLAPLGDFCHSATSVSRRFPGPGLRTLSDLVTLRSRSHRRVCGDPEPGAAGRSKPAFQERLQQSRRLQSWWKNSRVDRGPKLAT